MKFEVLEGFGKFTKGDKFESRKEVFKRLVKSGVLKEVRERKKKVIEKAPKNK